MKKSIFYPFISFYHKILDFFFDFDLHVYAHKMGKIKTNKFTDFKKTNPFKINLLNIPTSSANVISLKQPHILTYISPTLLSMLVLRNLEDEFYHHILIKTEQLNLLCVKRNYNLNLIENMQTKEENLTLKTNVLNFPYDEIKIDKKLKTIEELLELEPYTHKAKIEKITKIPVVKYQIKKEKFTEIQLSKMRTKLAIQAKCKTYSMTLENIYDNIPEGLFAEISLEKDNSLKCYFEKNPHVGEQQFLITGKRKYDTQITKALIKYSEIEIA